MTGCSNASQTIAIARGDEKTKYTTITNNIRNILKYVDTGWDGTKNADVRGALAGYSAASEVCGTSYDATVIESSLRGASAFSSAIDKLIADPPGILGTWDAATLATEMNDLARFHGIVGQCKAAVTAQPPGTVPGTPPGTTPPTQPDPCDELVNSLKSTQSRDHKTLRAASRACRTISEYEDITGPTSEADWQRWANMVTSLLDDPNRVMSERKNGEFISSRAKMYGATVNQTAFRSSVGMMDAVSLRVHRVVVAMSVAVFDKCMAKLGNFEPAEPGDAGAVNEFIEAGKPPANLPDDKPGISNKAAKDKAMQNEQLRQRLFK